LNKNQFVSLGLGLTILSLAWIFITPAFFSSGPMDTSIAATHPGFIAPSFTLETPFGDIYSLEDAKGQPILVFFWASWCTVCKSVMPGLESVYEEFAPLGFKIFAVNVTNLDVLSSALKYFSSQGYSFPMLIDQDGAVAGLYQIHAVPTSILIKPDGKISDVIIGSGLSEGFLHARLDQLMLEGKQ